MVIALYWPLRAVTMCVLALLLALVTLALAPVFWLGARLFHLVCALLGFVALTDNSQD
ncbi:hypothetical protein [Faunimonas pinastri]|uniref:hypothetical protein n=1 Tax=Faunimonas pinastri TaxID=1855383 RepID=UPI0015A63C4E|nr:hypothetical protein [Faunimonas pinastri]